MVSKVSVFAIQIDYNTNNYYKGTQYCNEDYKSSVPRVRVVFIICCFYSIRESLLTTVQFGNLCASCLRLLWAQIGYIKRLHELIVTNIYVC